MNLPRQRDLWTLLLVISLGAAAIVVLKTGVPASGDVALGGGAEASASLDPSAAPTEPAGSTPPEAPSLESLPADTRAQFDALPAGTILIACNSSSATYPEGIIPSVAGGWLMTHPGWRILEHGYCVDNPSTIKPFDVPVMDVP
ncbi:MAG: hypothetical protein AABZ33_06255 [Chloroflexota bacterium]